jgi:multiple sugar transport system permease protein
LGVALTSLRPASDLAQGNYFGMPSGIAWENYVFIFTETPIGQYMINSLWVTIPTVIGAVSLSLMTGFALAVYGFRANILVFFMFVAGNFVPFQILMVPVRDMTLQLGMYDTWYGLALFHIAFQTGFCTLFMRNFIKALPYELIEAARVEGVAEWRIFWYIVLPLMRPAIAALSVLVFTFIWNDFFWATVLTQGVDSQPITAGLSSLNGQWIAQWHLCQRRVDPCRPAAGADVLPDAEALHRRPDAWGREVMQWRIDAGLAQTIALATVGRYPGSHLVGRRPVPEARTWPTGRLPRGMT